MNFVMRKLDYQHSPIDTLPEKKLGIPGNTSKRT